MASQIKGGDCETKARRSTT